MDLQENNNQDNIGRWISVKDMEHPPIVYKKGNMQVSKIVLVQLRNGSIQFGLYDNFLGWFVPNDENYRVIAWMDFGKYEDDKNKNERKILWK